MRLEPDAAPAVQQRHRRIQAITVTVVHLLSSGTRTHARRPPPVSGDRPGGRPPPSASEARSANLCWPRPGAASASSFHDSCSPPRGGVPLCAPAVILSVRLSGLGRAANSGVGVGWTDGSTHTVGLSVIAGGGGGGGRGSGETLLYLGGEFQGKKRDGGGPG